MSTRVVAASILLCLALSVHADTHDSNQPNGCPSSLGQIQADYGLKTVPLAARQNLVARLTCLARPSKTSAGQNKPDDSSEIKTLEDIALNDLQGLLDYRAWLLKGQGLGADLSTLMDETVRAIGFLSPIVVESTEGKAALTPAFAKERTEHDATNATAACVNLTQDPSINQPSDVERCIDAINDEMAKAGGYRAKCLLSRRESLEDTGVRLAEKKKSDLRKLSQKRDAAKDAVEKDALDKQQKQLEQDLALLNEIAVVPASRRTCLNVSLVVSIEDAASVERCLDAIDLKIEATRLAHLAPPHEQGGRVAVLRLDRALIEDASIRLKHSGRLKSSLEEKKTKAGSKEKERLQEQIERIEIETPSVVLVKDAPSDCKARLPIAEDNTVKVCLSAIDREIGIADDRHAEWAARLDAGLDPYRRLREATEDRGSEIADGRRKALVELAAKITAAKDDAAKAPLVAQQDAMTSELTRLDQIATDPSMERHCVEDGSFKPKDTVAAARCMIIISNRIERTKIANTLPRDPAVEPASDRLNRKLKLLAFDLAHAATAPAPAGDAKKAEAKTSTAQAAPADSAADVKALTALALEPLAREACVTDPASNFKITDGLYAARCVAALTAAIEELEQNREEEPMDDGERKETIRHLMKQLGNFQAAGRDLLTQANAKMAGLKTKHDATQDDAERAKIDDSEKPLTAEITALKTVVIEQGADPQTGFADYDQWFTKLSLGYEYAGSTNAFSKGFPRIGATIGFHYPGQTAADLLSGWHPVGYGLYNTFTAWLTNSAESQTDLAGQFVPAASTKQVRALDGEGDPTTTTTPAPPVPLTRAIEFEDQFFMPFWRNGFLRENPRLRTVIGPLIVFGARKIDSESFARDRFYIGLRNARSPDTFYDLLYGRTDGLVSRRIEFRGQYSLPYIFKNNARIAIGAVGNFGINKRRFLSCEEGAPHCRQEEPDSIRFYLSYDIGGNDFLKFFGAKAPTP